MDQRKRLIELMIEAKKADTDDIPFSDFLADYLLANGVIVPPCKVGDTVYFIGGIHGTLIKQAKVEEIYHGEAGFAYRVCHDYTYFTLQQEETYFTKAEAEKALAERSNR